MEHDTYHSIDKGHGRLEDRHYWTISDPACIAYLNAKEAWTGLRSIGMVESERKAGEQVARERRYYLSSLPGNAQAFGGAVRSHWSVGAIRFAEMSAKFKDGEQGGEKLLDN